jgi:alkylhydroperoxidase family enzyme
LVQRGDENEHSVIKLYQDWHSVDLSIEDRTMLTYVEKLNFYPSGTDEKDLSRLRSVGFSDENITDIVMLTGYRAMLNRLHDALGVTLDHFYERYDAKFIDQFSK